MRTLLAAVLLVAILLPARAAPGADAPALVLFLTVDQLRGDMLPRFAATFRPGGFRRLLDDGVHYTTAHFRHATTFTSTGHATLVTGGNPPEHGIVGNRWADPATGQYVYSVEDDRHHLLDVETTAHRGTSPRNLLGSTIGDELVRASNGRSRVFAVSVKDRGAILPAGHLGKAYWYDSRSGRFVTSSYYHDETPAWLGAWNATAPLARYEGTAWDLLDDRATYARADSDDRCFETTVGSLGHTFPHPLRGTPEHPLSRLVVETPMADELTLEVALALLDAESIGARGATDMLAISFSATDYIGHTFGPNSLEAEDNLRRLDRTLARLLDVIDAAVGLDRTVVVLSADHGIDAAPEHHHLGAHGSCDDERFVPRDDGSFVLGPVDDAADGPAPRSGRLYPALFIPRLNAALRTTFDVDTDLIDAFWNPCLYLDMAAVAAHDLDPAAVERAVAVAAESIPGMALAVTRSDLRAGRVPATPVGRAVARSFHPQRSGHVFLVQAPSWSLYHNATANAAMHGSPWSYDTHVPIVFRGPGSRGRTVARRVGPEDIAPTLARLLGIESPSGCVGEVLTEVLDDAPDATPDRIPGRPTDAHAR